MGLYQACTYKKVKKAHTEGSCALQLYICAFDQGEHCQFESVSIHMSLVIDSDDQEATSCMSISIMIALPDQPACQITHYSC